MTFAVVGRVASIDGETARVVTIGGPIDASLVLLTAQRQPIEVGDWVIVALGLVLEMISHADATRLVEDQRVA